MNQPSPDNVVLGLLAVQPCHGYQLLEYFHDPAELGRVWLMSTSQMYAVLKRLERQEFIVGREVQPADAPTRTEYVLTEAGRDNLMVWLNERQPSASVRWIRVEFLSRLYLARKLKLPAGPLIQSQKAACELQRRVLLAQREAEAGAGIGSLALDFILMQLDAVLHWLDACKEET